MKTWIFVATLALSALPFVACADGVAAVCERGRLTTRVACLGALVGEQEGRIRELEAKLGQSVPRSEIENMIKAKIDEAMQSADGKFLHHGSEVSIRSVAHPDLCVDLRSQDTPKRTIQAWECNNNKNHRLQHWTLTSKN